MKKDFFITNRKTIRFLHWIPWILFAALTILLVCNSFLPDATKIDSSLLNGALYLFAIVSFLISALLIAADIVSIVLQKSGKPVILIVLTVLIILVWIFILNLNSAFS